MSGPYRTQLERPERFESYWLLLERRQRSQKKLPLVLAALALVPALAVLSMVAIGKASAHESPAVLAKALGEPWGLVISPTRTAPFVGTHPTGGDSPKAGQSPIPAAELQRLLGARADGFRKCYADTLPYNPGLAGDLIVSIAIRDGKSMSALSGRSSLRHGLGWCIERELESVEFPSTHGDVVWVHFPLRFER